MIEFKKGTPDAIDCNIYLMSQKEDEALRDFLTEQLEKGCIHPSKSQYASFSFFIQKKDRKQRPVQDYQRINDCTIQNQYPLPLITDLITDLQGAHIYTKLDICWGYNNVCIKEGDEHKAAFKTRYGLYEPTVMFFGLTNSPATFQTMMNHIFRPIIAKHKLLGTSIHVYMDDIAIATRTNDNDHTAAVTDILALAAEHNLYFKLEKCLFHVPSINYLGVILEKGVTCMDLVKIAGLKNWPTLTKVKDICSFLGFCNFYHAFIKGFLSIAQPLNALTRKDQTWAWTEEHRKAFNALKAQVTSEPILMHPELDKQFKLEVDASGFAVEAVLLQKKNDGTQHPVGYYSTTLNAAEWNYDIYDLELLAIVKALKHWCPLLAGSPHKIKVFSDHMNLKYWRDPQKIS